MIGLTVGDVLGVPLEFKSPGTFEPIDDIVGGGAFGLEPGEWTDDTSMALCLAESLIEKQGFDPIDQLERYLRWYREGYLSVNGKCFDIGKTTREALFKFEMTHQPFLGPNRENTAGNGSLMRLAPIPLFFNSNPLLAIEKSMESSRTTHGNILAVDACRYFGGLIYGALNGESKDNLLSGLYSPINGYWEENPLAEEIEEVVSGSFKNKNPEEIDGSGYVVKSLEAVLWAFYNSSNFEEGCLKVVNLGDDADTNGAIYGQIAGAYYGESGIPKNWVEKIAKFNRIDSIIERLFEVSEYKNST